jgi:hypothetical protein
MSSRNMRAGQIALLGRKQLAQRGTASRKP